MEQKAKFKLGWFNVFNLGGALYGWHATHTWEGVAWGYFGVTIGLPLVLIVAFSVAILGCKAVEALADAIPTRVRIAQSCRVETDEQRWEREYAEHCKAIGVPNELSAPIHREPDYTTTTTSSSDTSYWGGTTSGFGPG